MKLAPKNVDHAIGKFFQEFDIIGPFLKWILNVKDVMQNSQR